jgi:chromate transporter
LSAPTPGNAAPDQTSLGEIAGLFLKLGTVAFGGPAAHIAMMEDEVVRRRSWLSREAYLDYLGATNLIPGPNSTELAIHIGRAQAGWQGLLVAGTCFILPSALLTAGFGWAYVRYGSLPAAEGALYGVKPVVIAVVLQALWGLGRTALKTGALVVLAIAAVVALSLGVHELAVLAGAGMIMAALRGAGTGRSSFTLTSGASPGTVLLAGTAAASAAPFGLWPLFGVFAKIGAVLFGSGYVLLAFLRADLVERFGWLTERQLLDAVAVGQVTPGPVFTTATFIGYILGGGRGAVVATVGIFLPAFIFVALSGVALPALRRWPTTGAVLDGVNVASLALMGVVSWQLARSALVDPVAIGLAAVSGVLLFGFRVNSAGLVVAGAIIGALVRG